jgi:hypothetical protein
MKNEKNMGVQVYTKRKSWQDFRRCACLRLIDCQEILKQNTHVKTLSSPFHFKVFLISFLAPVFRERAAHTHLGDGVSVADFLNCCFDGRQEIYESTANYFLSSIECYRRSHVVYTNCPCVSCFSFSLGWKQKHHAQFPHRPK